MMQKIDWVRKLTSRKFWTAVASFVSMLIVALGGTENQATQITALIIAGATVLAYIIGEGLVDAVGSQRCVGYTHIPQNRIVTQNHELGELFCLCRGTAALPTYHESHDGKHDQQTCKEPSHSHQDVQHIIPPVLYAPQISQTGSHALRVVHHRPY